MYKKPYGPTSVTVQFHNYDFMADTGHGSYRQCDDAGSETFPILGYSDEEPDPWGQIVEKRGEVLSLNDALHDLQSQHPDLTFTLSFGLER